MTIDLKKLNNTKFNYYKITCEDWTLWTCIHIPEDLLCILGSKRLEVFTDIYVDVQFYRDFLMFLIFLLQIVFQFFL